MTTALESPLAQFFDAAGLPLSQGKIYIGQPNQNPETAPLTVYWDDASTQPAAQPLRTKGGYIVRNGAPAAIFVPTDYSISVRDRKGVLVYYLASALQFSAASQLQQLLTQSLASRAPSVNTVAALRAITLASHPNPLIDLAGYRAVGDGGAGRFWYDPSDTTTADNDGTVLVDSAGRRWKRYYTGSVYAGWFGVIADAVPATQISAGGYGTFNVTAINRALVESWKNPNYPPETAAGGFGGEVVLPDGYIQIAGTLPIIVNPANRLRGANQFGTVLCCTAAYNPNVTMADGNTQYLGAIYQGPVGAPYTGIPGYPTEVTGITLLGLNSPGHGVFLNSNVAILKGVWISGFTNGLVLTNIDSQVDATVENCPQGVTLAPFAYGNTVKVLVNKCTIPLVSNNRKWYSIFGTGNTGGTTPAVVIAANQGLNTGYTFNGVAVSAADFTGYRVKVVAGTGKGQLGRVTASSLSTSTWRFTLTLASESGAWTALDATSKVVLMSLNKENYVRMEGENNIQYYALITESQSLILESACLSTPSAAAPSAGGMLIEKSEDTTISSIGLKGALEDRIASTTADGVIIGADVANLRFLGGQISGWRNGITAAVGSVVSGLIVDGMTITGNSEAGIKLSDGASAVLSNNYIANNGKSGTPGTGMLISWPQANATLAITGNNIDGFTGGATNQQGTGLSLNVGQASARVSVTGNTVHNHSVANYNITGVIDGVSTDPTVPRAIATVNSAATITIPTAQLGGAVEIAGSTTITSITAVEGAQITLMFSGTAQMTDGGNLALAGNYTGGAGRNMTLRCRSGVWQEQCRSTN